MVSSRTPFRISFFGGGTDYPAWYLKEEGAVLSTTIDKYCYISCRELPPFFTTKFRIVWSHIENVSTISEILHPAVREGLKFMGMDDNTGLEIHHQGDLPARSGMGSSSSFAVGLIKALTALRGKIIGQDELAFKAIELEQSILKENVGSQDQIAAAYGGFNLIRFLKNGDIRVEPVTINRKRIEKLESRLLLFYTGASRLASEVAGDVISNFGKKQSELRQMQAMVDKALSILNSEDSLDNFGKLLHETWMLKRTTSDLVSNPVIDKIYKKAIEHGALGGKLLGAGSSGFMIFYTPLEKQNDVINTLNAYLYVPFKFESEGSTIIYYTEKY
ncbi:D-glycero-alpha-D-manno-heptose-7-phosphate kinase [Candidatus Magnetomoraceae bacterium gMMP-1]